MTPAKIKKEPVSPRKSPIQKPDEQTEPREDKKQEEIIDTSNIKKEKQTTWVCHHVRIHQLAWQHFEAEWYRQEWTSRKGRHEYTTENCSILTANS